MDKYPSFALLFILSIIFLVYLTKIRLYSYCNMDSYFAPALPWLSMFKWRSSTWNNKFKLTSNLCKESNLLHVSTKEVRNISVSLESHSSCLHGSMNCRITTTTSQSKKTTQKKLTSHLILYFDHRYCSSASHFYWKCTENVPWRRGGLIVGALDTWSSGPGSSSSRGHCVVFWARHFTLTVPLSI